MAEDTRNVTGALYPNVIAPANIHYQEQPRTRPACEFSEASVAHARRVRRAADRLVAHPTLLPWYLAKGDLTPPEARSLVGALTAVLMALCEDREDNGRPLPSSGVEGLIETALEAWTVDAPEQDRVVGAYAVLLDELAVDQTIDGLPVYVRCRACLGMKPR